METLKLTRESKPEEVLKLERGELYQQHYMEGECPFEDKHVIECAELIIKNGGSDEEFKNQAGVIECAGNELGWGASEGYYAFPE